MKRTQMNHSTDVEEKMFPFSLQSRFSVSKFFLIHGRGRVNHAKSLPPAHSMKFQIYKTLKDTVNLR